MSRAPSVAHSDTSRQAAESIEQHLGPIENQIFSVIERADTLGCTTDELEIVLGMAHQTASARVVGLRTKHKIMDSGLRRRTRGGRLAVVWVVGHDYAPSGAPNDKLASRPSAKEIGVAIREISSLLKACSTTPSEELKKLGKWLKDIEMRG